MVIESMTSRNFTRILFALFSILLSSANAMDEILFNALEADTPLTHEQTIRCNSLLDEISTLDDNVSFTPIQTRFVTAICSSLKREMKDVNTAEYTLNRDPLVLLLGVTGSGKSTVADLLTQKRLEARRSPENPKRINIVGPNTGQNGGSKTTKPGFCRDPENGFTYADCPGSQDTRGRLQQVKNAIYMNGLFNHHDSVRFLIVDTAASIEDVAYGGNFIATLRELKKTVGNLSPANISLAVTQHGEDHMSVEYLRQHMGRLAQNSSYQDIRDLLVSLADPASRIAFFSRPPRDTVEGPYADDRAREDLLSAIRGTPPLLLDVDTRKEIRIAFSDFATVFVNRIKTGLTVSMRALVERGVVRPIKFYIEEKTRGTRVLIDRRICAEDDAQNMLGSYLKDLATELGSFKAGVLALINDESITYPAFVNAGSCSSDNSGNGSQYLLKIIRQRIKPDAETDVVSDAKTEADFSVIKRMTESLGCLYRIKGISGHSFAEDVVNPALAELEQNLTPCVPVEETQGWIDQLVFARRLIQATKAPRVHTYRVPTTRNSGGIRYRHFREEYWHLPRTLMGLALGNSGEERIDFRPLRGNWDYARVNRHLDLLEVVRKELKELKAKARLTIYKAQSDAALYNKLTTFDGFIEWPVVSELMHNNDNLVIGQPRINVGWRDHVIATPEYIARADARLNKFNEGIASFAENSDNLFDATSSTCNVCNPSMHELLTRRFASVSDSD